MPITHSNIKEWRYIEKGRIKNKIGIRVNGSSMDQTFMQVMSWFAVRHS